MKKQDKTNAMRILEKSGINFEAVFYNSDGFMDGVSVAEKLGQDLRDVYKTLVTESKNHEYFVFVIPVAEELDLKKCAAAVGQKSLEMIHVKDMSLIHICGSVPENVVSVVVPGAEIQDVSFPFQVSLSLLHGQPACLLYTS